MARNAQSTKNTRAETPDAPDPGAASTAAFATLMQRNVERMAGLQKATLDVLSSQTADVAATLRTSAPAGMDAWVRAQKEALDMVVKQSAEITGTAARETGDLFQQAADRTLEAQRNFLDLAAKQNKAVIDTQKDFLDTAARFIKSAGPVKG